MSATATRTCAGCGAELPPERGPGRARKWCSESCRRHTLYSGECIDCGGPTYSGTVPPSKRCQSCARAYEIADVRWTDEAIIAAIRRWVEIHGEPPRAPVWLDGRQRGHDYPSVTLVQEIFGTWNAAIRAAGLTPRQKGHTGTRPGEDMALCYEIRERYEQGESSIQLAASYGASAHGITYRILKAGGRIRSAAEAQRLRRDRELAA